MKNTHEIKNKAAIDRDQNSKTKFGTKEIQLNENEKKKQQKIEQVVQNSKSCMLLKNLDIVE